ncbi:MAG: hypothetical protein CVU39_07945 [Chloroflexi bacterium HGW-Chloroflexi-10]|nr:MAG: hypothetical protein CVU39_07945 [Chloroflexi bacterium HGW-Chloroflexi-10]
MFPLLLLLANHCKQAVKFPQYSFVAALFYLKNAVFFFEPDKSYTNPLPAQCDNVYLICQLFAIRVDHPTNALVSPAVR